ncbi:hypothetical protein JOF42_000786 [Microbacterium phyllosphaerae]|uniref:Uncharacterized protein n=1 Tax=Microbacterium phyllosphaerae TaxID=124798 RepID=A0ABS4WMN5_9MICO|nr:hypothetical protein [Microbacterium phyllosphaerae]MBP2377291.1 hypothetical protein [Microbacterium phyllosphaerae]
MSQASASEDPSTRTPPRRRATRLISAAAMVAVAGLVGAGLYVFVDRLKDSDGDGLPDHVESSGWVTVRGATFVTDPWSADTDGDGLTDSQEAGDAEGVGYVGVSDPTRSDSDGDGLGDQLEVLGWQSTAEITYRTDPLRADSDSDGLDDGIEAGASRAPDRAFAIFADPLDSDTDADGLNDSAEADLSLDPFHTDTDLDGLDDRYEVDELGTAADSADTDDDGLEDGYEVSHRADQGLDPLWPDQRVDALTFATEFAQGAVLGELAPGDTLAWLAGNLAAGGTSFIPGVGWVAGSVVDLRDAVGSAIRADWVGAGFSMIGLVPVTGDLTAFSGKVARFMIDHPGLAPAAAAAVVALDWLPDRVKLTALKSATPEGWSALGEAGFSDKALLKLQKGKTGINTLASAMSGPGHVSGTRARFFATGPDAEAWLTASLQSSRTKADTQVVFSTAACAVVCNAVARRVDAMAAGIAHESKSGRVYLTESIEAQLRSDAYLVDEGLIEGAHWHFFASSESNSIGPSGPVVTLLEDLGIAYTVHPPRA